MSLSDDSHQSSNFQKVRTALTCQNHYYWDISKDLGSWCPSLGYWINYISLTKVHICLEVIYLSTKLSLIMLTLPKICGDHKKMPSQHQFSWVTWVGVWHINEVVWQVHGMLGKLIAGLRLQLYPTLFNWCWMGSKGLCWEIWWEGKSSFSFSW